MFSISYKQRASSFLALCFRYFQINSLANLTLFTLKKGYARNVCDVSHFDTFAYFCAIIFYFLLDNTLKGELTKNNTILFTASQFNNLQWAALLMSLVQYDKDSFQFCPTTAGYRELCEQF